MQSNLEKIVLQLPRYSHAEWAKEAFTLWEKGKVPSFENLMNYVTTKAKLASSALGRLIGSKPQEDKFQKLRNKRPLGAMLFAVQGDSKSPCCYYCKKPGHLLEKCYSFRNEKFEARKEFV